MTDDLVRTRLDRRDVLRKGAIGAGVAWTAPTLLSINAAASASPSMLAPIFRGLVSLVITTGSGSINTPADTAIGDRLLFIAAFGAAATFTPPPSVNLVQSGLATSGEPEVHLYEKPVTVGGIENLAFSCDISVTLAVAIVLYRPGTGGTSVAIDDSASDFSGLGTTHQFPAIAAGPSNRRIVRLGGAGWLGFSGSWLTAPGPNVRLLTSQGGDQLATVQVSDGVDDIAAADGTTNLFGGAYRHSVALITV